MKKMDAKFYGDLYKAKDHTRVPDDQYIVFLVKDNAFMDLLVQYGERCRAHGADEEQVNAAEAMIDRAKKWRNENRHLCKTPDAAGEALLGTE